MGTFLHTGAQHSIALDAYRRGALRRKIASRLGTHLFQQRRKRGAVAPGRGLTVHKSFGVNKIRVHKTGVEHPGEKCKIQRVAVCPVRRGALGQGDLAPAIVRLHWFFQPSEQGSVSGIGCPFVATVRQTGVVPGYGKGRLNVGRTALHRFLRTGGRVVGCSTARQPLLESCAVFANVVQPCGVFGLLCCAKGGGKSSGKACCAGKMLVDGLGAGAVLGNMCKCFVHIEPSVSGSTIQRSGMPVKNWQKI